MTREEWKERFPLVKAFVEGKKIEYREVSGAWVPAECMNFEDKLEVYRIKSEPKFVPFTFEDNLVGKTVVSKNTSIRHLIIEQTTTDIYISTTNIPYKHLLTYFTFLDGSPCGKMEDE